MAQVADQMQAQPVRPDLAQMAGGRSYRQHHRDADQRPEQHDLERVELEGYGAPGHRHGRERRDGAEHPDRGEQGARLRVVRRGTAGDSVEIAYAIGLQYGLQFRQDTSNTLDRGLFLAGVQAALAGEESPLTPEQVRAAQSAVEDSVQLRQLRAAAPTNPQARARLDLIRANQTQADSFLTAARGTEGVQELGNGVLYRVDEPGDGASPQLGQRVTVRYRGTLPNGQVFDQTQEEPATFLVDNVVPGFQAALLDMQVGETRTVFIPPSQGYGLGGSQGPGGQGGIPPNAALQFEITLLDVADGPTPGAQFDPSQLGL